MAGLTTRFPASLRCLGGVEGCLCASLLCALRGGGEWNVVAIVIIVKDECMSYVSQVSLEHARFTGLPQRQRQ